MKSSMPFGDCCCDPVVVLDMYDTVEVESTVDVDILVVAVDVDILVVAVDVDILVVDVDVVILDIWSFSITKHMLGDLVWKSSKTIRPDVSGA